MPVHSHGPYNPPCNERVVEGRLRGACLPDTPAEQWAAYGYLREGDHIRIKYTDGEIDTIVVDTTHLEHIHDLIETGRVFAFLAHSRGGVAVPVPPRQPAPGSVIDDADGHCWLRASNGLWVCISGPTKRIADWTHLAHPVTVLHEGAAA